MNTVQYILQHKIVAIIRGAEPKQVIPIVGALYDGGIRIVEITLNSENAFELIGELSSTMKNKMLVGAGTVLDKHGAKEAMKQGAQFIISPSLDVELIEFVKKKRSVSIPGAFTATEVVTAFKAGADIIKIFPAPGPQYIKDLRGPLLHIPMMPTGGITKNNIGEFQKAGAVAFGVGSALVNGAMKVTEASLSALAENAKQLVAAVHDA